ncbi:hypothetical protein Lser_V15G20216 [Lactuca serriola]
MKPPVISISSDEEDDDGIFEEEELESELSSQDDTDYSESDDQEYDEEEENDVESDEEECSDNQGSNGIKELSLVECKAYLRKHGLRLSGSKEECRQRIKEHERLKDAGGESIYPRSSFSINCTGDACKGDVVLFKQKIKYDKGANRGNIVGKRTVAGRIVKESYGASKQQHTFTVEVLWNKGWKKLPVLSTLLVKGRNLYRYGTFRQPWKSEAERSKVLEEKHKRGEAARHIRKSNKTEIPSNNNNNNKRKLKKTEFLSNNNKGRKRQKLSNKGPSRSKQPTRTPKQNSTTARKRKPIYMKKTEMPFRADPNRSIYLNHHRQQQEASLLPVPYERISSFPNMSLLGVPRYTVGQPPRQNPIMYQYEYQYQYQPRDYHHYTI